MSEPILLIPAFRSGRETPWAGDTLHRKYEKYTLGNLIGESYDFSTLPDLQSFTPDGTKLSELTKSYPALPFMIKWVNAKSPMSIHIHPQHDEHLIVTDVEDDARIVAGFKQNVEIEQLKELLSTTSLEDIFFFKSVQQCDIIHIPAGVPHSLMGVTCYQIQAPLTDSFRLYNWNRTNTRGQKRSLQLEKAQSCLSRQPVTFSSGQINHCIHTSAFDVERLHGISDKKIRIAHPYSVLTCLAPAIITLETGKRLYLCAGQTVFIPSDSVDFTLSGEYFLIAMPRV